MTVPSLQHTGHGYEYCRCRAAGRDDTVYIHRLTFVAEHGLDALREERRAAARRAEIDVEDVQVQIHHIDSIPWDNRPANLQAVAHFKHAKHHFYGEGPGVVGEKSHDKNGSNEYLSNVKELLNP